MARDVKKYKEKRQAVEEDKLKEHWMLLYPD